MLDYSKSVNILDEHAKIKYEVSKVIFDLVYILVHILCWLRKE